MEERTVGSASSTSQKRVKSGELPDSELLGAGVGTKAQQGEGFARAIGFGKRSQVVDQSFSFLREAHLHKIQETGIVGEGELCALAGKTQSDERGGNFGRRSESVARNLEDEFGTRVELGDDGQVAVISSAGLGGEAMGNFGLDDDVDFVDDAGEIEKVMEDGRSNVVGKIAVDTDAAAGSDGGNIRFEDVAGDDGEIGEFLREAAEASDELRIEFESVNGPAGGEEMFGHFAVAGTDFDPAVLVIPRKRGGGMRGNANGAGDLLAPVEIGEEMLAEVLASHGWNSVARGGGERLNVGKFEP